MKKTVFTIFVGISALAAATAIAGHHEGAGDDEKMAAWNAKIEAKFAEVDADGNGQITKEEFIAHKLAAAEKDWADHSDFIGDDGMASLDEAKAYHHAKMAEKKSAHKAMHSKMHGEAENTD